MKKDKICKKCGGNDFYQVNGKNGNCKPCKHSYEKNKRSVVIVKSIACHKCNKIDYDTRGRCKQCARNRMVAVYANNPAPLRMAQKIYRENNPEKIIEARRIDRIKNPTLSAKRSKKWANNNPEKIKKTNAKSRLKNIEKCRARYRQWSKDNKEKVNILGHNYRARRNNANGRLSHGLTDKLLILQQGRCACCKVLVKKTGHHLDHIYPLSKGGSNEDSNIQILCPTCNCRKGAKHPNDFMQSQGFLF